MSRAGSGIGVGSISFHPAGFVHGPQPGSYEASVDQQRTEEIAVMIDTFAPLRVTDTARRISAPDYPWSWAGERLSEVTPAHTKGSDVCAGASTEGVPQAENCSNASSALVA